MNTMRHFAVLVMLVIFVPAGIAIAGQPLETETARLMPAHSFEFDTTLEYQTSSEGKETAVPFAFEYGITRKLELMIEPVVYTAIRPDQGIRATGAGDVEVTATYLLHQEKNGFPAFAVAGELKLPTAQNELIGTGKTDYTGYFIVSKALSEKTDLHADIGYSFLGSPAGVNLKNIINYAAALEYHLNSKWEVVGEVVGNTSSSDLAEGGTPAGQPLTAEVTGSETTGMVGMRYAINRNFIFALGVTYDNNKAVLIRPGITLFF